MDATAMLGEPFMGLCETQKLLGFYDLTHDDLDSLNRGKRLVLNVLKDCQWHTNVEILGKTGQTEALRRLRDLRSDGFVIETEKRGRKCRYRWTGEREAMEAVSQKLQEAYYQTSHWIRVKKARIEIDSGRCVICKRLARQVHHLTYELFNESVHEHLITVCRKHHEFMHEHGKYAFPRKVRASVAQRIRDEMERPLVASLDHEQGATS